MLQKFAVTALISLVVAVAAWVLFSGEAKQREWSAASQAALRRPTGHAQLVSYDPLPPMNMMTEGGMCEWIPASAPARLVAALRQERQAAASSADASASIHVDRAPVRVIRDSYATFSAVAVDVARDEVVLQDESFFSILVYNRTDNTPPDAAMTEPKRVISGPKTKVQFNCALYIDPKSGDIYSVNNDTMDTMTIFSRDARGNVAPDRELRTPHRTYGIAVDEEKQELFLAVEHPSLVAVYHKMASGDDEPIRTLEGPRTQLEDAHGIAVDTKNQLMYVSNHGHTSNPREPGGGSFELPSITVYPLGAQGDTPPLRVIEGSQTQLNWPANIYLDVEHQELFVANDAGNSILVFRASDSGNAAPIRAIKGPQTGIKYPTGVFLDEKNDELWVSNMGNHSATVYRRTADGDVPPLRTIRSAPRGKVALAIGNPGAVGYDSKREEILVPN